MFILPALVGLACTYARWHRHQYETLEVELYYDVIHREPDIKQWKATWGEHVEQFKWAGGCDCCVSVYRIRGPRAAIDAFPMNSISRRAWEEGEQMADSLRSDSD